MSDILEIEIRTRPLTGVKLSLKVLPRRTNESPIVGSVQAYSAELLSAFASDIPLAGQVIPEPEFFVKLYAPPQKERCDDEITAWQMIRQSPYFDMVPAVLSKSFESRILTNPWYGDEKRYCIFMEKAYGAELDTWFEQISRTAPNPPIVIHQFFCVWFQLFNFLKYTHSAAVGFYHADIKPDNLRFFNNALRLLDFNASTTLPYDLPYGTARYAPNCVLDSTRPVPRQERYDLGSFDLYCSGIALLEVLMLFYSKFYRGAGQVFSRLQECFQRKKDAAIKDGRSKWEELKSQNLLIYGLVGEWEKTSPIGRQFRSLLDEDNLQPRGKAGALCEAVLSPSMKEYSSWALADLSFTETNGTLTKGLKIEFPKLMGTLLHNYSRRIFSDSYPLLYLDYSDHTQTYNLQASTAVNCAIQAMGGAQETVLDVGCAFGTAALKASEAGFTKITCIDNNPYFHRLAGLLWREPAFDTYSRYFPSAKRIFDAIYGGQGEKRIYELLTKYNGIFRAARAESWRYWVVDYWGLTMIPFGSSPFDYIVCGNFLHWPIIDFERMSSDCSNYYIDDSHLGRSRLNHLLSPLLGCLKSKGCLAIVEPSQFFQNDLDLDADLKFHADRFSEHPVYKEAHIYARGELAKEMFDTEWPVPKAREIKFLSSAFQELNTLGYKVSLNQLTLPFGSASESSATVWINTIIGEFNMTLRNLPLESLQQMSADKLHLFYEKFRNYLEALQMPKEPPPSRIYVIQIQKN